MEKGLSRFNSYLTNDEFQKWEERLVNILVLNQYRYYSEKQEEIDRRKRESSICGSLCISEDDLPGETWVPYLSEESPYSISSYGRVRFGNRIVPQRDADGKSGYLILDEHRFGQKLLKYFVYDLVAVAFLQKPSETGYEVHHITNNGYDNSVGNLIYLTTDQHKSIHNSEEQLRKA